MHTYDIPQSVRILGRTRNATRSNTVSVMTFCTYVKFANSSAHDFSYVNSMPVLIHYLISKIV